MRDREAISDDPIVNLSEVNTPADRLILLLDRYQGRAVFRDRLFDDSLLQPVSNLLVKGFLHGRVQGPRFLSNDRSRGKFKFQLQQVSDTHFSFGFGCEYISIFVNQAQ